MVDALTKKRVHRLLLILIVGIFALVGFGILFLSQLIHYINLPSPSTPTIGKIYVTKYGGRRSRNECLVTYEVNGKEYLNTSTGGCNRFNDGEEVTIYYKTDNPNKAALDARNVGYFFGIIGLVLAIITYFLVVNFRNKLKNGE